MSQSSQDEFVQQIWSFVKWDQKEGSLQEDRGSWMLSSKDYLFMLLLSSCLAPSYVIMIYMVL